MTAYGAGRGTATKAGPGSVFILHDTKTGEARTKLVIAGDTQLPEEGQTTTTMTGKDAADFLYDELTITGTSAAGHRGKDIALVVPAKAAATRRI